MFSHGYVMLDCGMILAFKVKNYFLFGILLGYMYV